MSILSYMNICKTKLNWQMLLDWICPGFDTILKLFSLFSHDLFSWDTEFYSNLKYEQKKLMFGGSKYK